MLSSPTLVLGEVEMSRRRNIEDWNAGEDGLDEVAASSHAEPDALSVRVKVVSANIAFI